MEIEIPYTLNEAIVALQTVLSEKDFMNFKNGPESKVCTWHNDLGRWIRNNWNLWAGGCLSAYFNSLGIHHPDDMSGIILYSAHRSWNDKDINLEEQIKACQDHWKQYEKI